MLICVPLVELTFDGRLGFARVGFTAILVFALSSGTFFRLDVLSAPILSVSCIRFLDLRVLYIVFGDRFAFLLPKPFCSRPFTSVVSVREVAGFRSLSFFSKK